MQGLVVQGLGVLKNIVNSVPPPEGPTHLGKYLFKNWSRTHCAVAVDQIEI